MSDIKDMASKAMEELKNQNKLSEDDNDIYKQLREEAGEAGTTNYEQKDETELIQHTPNKSNSLNNINIKYNSDTDISYEDIEHLPTENDIDPETIINHTPQEIFPGGPTIDVLESWKKQYSDCGIFQITIQDIPFIIRTINRFEYKQIVGLQNLDALQREEIICNTCTLWPILDYDAIATEKGGIPSTLAAIIMNKSGFCKDYTIKEL